MVNFSSKRLLPASRLLCSVIFMMCLAHHSVVYAFSDELTGYYITETNQCPQALSDQKKTGKWSGLTITPIELVFPDGISCALNEESHGAGALRLALLCATDQKRSGVYEFSGNDTRLVVIRNREHQSYVKCRGLNSSGTSNASQNGRQNTGVDVGGGMKMHPYANNNSLRMKMNVPFP